MAFVAARSSLWRQRQAGVALRSAAASAAATPAARQCPQQQQQPRSFATRRPKGYRGPMITYRNPNPPDWYKEIEFPAQKRFLVRRYDEIFRTCNLVLVFQGHSTPARHDEVRVQLAPFFLTTRVQSSIARMALWNTPLQDLTGLFSGPTDIAFVENADADPLEALRAFKAAHKDEPTMLLGGCLWGRPLTVDMIDRLLLLPSSEHAMAELITILNQPARNVIKVLNNPINNLVKVLKFKAGPLPEVEAEATGEAQEAASQA